MNTVIQHTPIGKHTTSTLNQRPAARAIVARTRGTTRGPVTRLVSPSDLGELIKPFIFLDHGVVPPTKNKLFGMHPHSGIATLSLPVSGAIFYQDTAGEQGVVKAGGLEWMQAGNGVWHDGGVWGDIPLEFFQLWVALPAQDENGPAYSQNIEPTDIPVVGPVAVLLGQYQGAVSPIEFTAGVNYYHVQLQDGEVWHYQPEPGQKVAWLSLNKGHLTGAGAISKGEMVVFEPTEQAITVLAKGATSFVFGAAIPHPYPLVKGMYSVHTNRQALVQGEQEIKRIGQQLRAQGRI